MQRNDKDQEQLWWIVLMTIAISSAMSVDASPQGTRPDTGAAVARAVIARNDSAMGRVAGKDPFLHTHMVTETQMTPERKTVTEVWVTTPKRFLTRMTIPEFGVMETGYNGTVGWSISPHTGPVLLEGEQLKLIEKQMQTASSPVQAAFKTLSAAPRIVVEGKTVTPINFSTDDGNGGTFYFDAATGLLHAMRARVSDGTAVDSSMFMLFGDYKRMGGSLVNTSMTMKTTNGMSIVTRTTHLDHAVIDTARFTPPPAVRELIAAAPARRP